MARTFVRQTQISGSTNFSYLNQDSRENIHNNPSDLLSDINSIRSVIKDISGESEYYLSASIKSLKSLSDEMKYFLTSSAVLQGTLTVNNNISLNNDAQIRLTSNTANTLFGMYDGTILGPYYQMWGNNHSSATQRGTAEFVFDTRNNGGGFNIAGYDGSTWNSYFKIDRNGNTNITGSLNIVNGNLSGSNGSFSGHLTASSLIISDPITLSNQVVNKSYVDNLVVPPSGSASKIYYVSKIGNDSTGNGSMTSPYLTIQAAHDAADNDVSATDHVIIHVGPGEYTEDLNISRERTTFICEDRDSRQKSVIITGKIEIDCTGASNVLNDVVEFDGFNIVSSVTSDPTILVTGTSNFSIILNNSHINSTAGSGNSIQSNGSGTNLIRLRNSIVEGNSTEHAVNLSNGSLITNQSSIVSLNIPVASTTSSVVYLTNNSEIISANNSLYRNFNIAPVFRLDGTNGASGYKVILDWTDIVNGINDVDACCIKFDTSGLFSKITHSNLSTVGATNIISGSSYNFTSNNSYIGTFTNIFEPNITGVSVFKSDLMSGDLTGSFPDPEVVKLRGRMLTSTAPNVNEAYMYNGSEWVLKSLVRTKETITVGSITDEITLTEITSLPSDINRDLNVYLNGFLLNCSGSNSTKADVIADGIDASQKDVENKIIFGFDLQVNDVIIIEKY